MSFIILFFHLSFVYVALHFCLISYNVYMESMKLYKFCNCLKRTNKYFLSSHSNFFSSLFSWCMDLLDTSHFCPFNLSILISNLHSHFFSICVSLLSYLIWNSLIARAYCIRWGRQQKKKNRARIDSQTRHLCLLRSCPLSRLKSIQISQEVFLFFWIMSWTNRARSFS